jgi:acyl-CoA synthetase (AMP-forming)/AMP-acid ligase II
MGPAHAPVSYATLWAQARAAAAGLAGRPHDHVVHIGINSPAVPVAIFASGLLGRPFAPLNYRLADADLRRLLARTAPATAIVDDDMVDRVAGVAGVEILSRAAFLADAEAGAAVEHDLPEAAPDIAVLLFTSGTTGEPKAAVLRHRHLAAYVISTVEFAGAEDGEAALISVPPYHIAGVSAVLTGVYGGRRIVHLPVFSPEAWVEAAAAERITHAMVVPTMLGRILEVLEARDERLSRLHSLSYGGGRMPPSVIARALEWLPHVNFVNAYGLTETSSTISVLRPDDHRAARDSIDPSVRRRLASVGRPLPGLELEIRGPGGEAIPQGQTGEVWVRGDQISGEYLGRKLIRDDGWFPTKDSGWLDEAGYLFIEGRLDDVIVRGGENISPGEIEDVLRGHPAVSDVAVLGVPDDDWGERVAAVVVAKSPVDAEALRVWVRERLRSTRAPADVLFRAELPYNETGKLLRRVLKAQIAGPAA